VHVPARCASHRLTHRDVSIARATVGERPLPARILRTERDQIGRHGAKTVMDPPTVRYPPSGCEDQREPGVTQERIT
jgi:hypothetical protein